MAHQQSKQLHVTDISVHALFLGPFSNTYPAHPYNSAQRAKQPLSRQPAHPGLPPTRSALGMPTSDTNSRHRSLNSAMCCLHTGENKAGNNRTLSITQFDQIPPPVHARWGAGTVKTMERGERNQNEGFALHFQLA